ncbi:MAG: class B sortase [Lachnospiraceae bacterium]|nr:class B sortase [Lachnospiraceae bacterium]
MNDTETKKNKGGFGIIRTIVLVAAFAVLIYSGYQLYTIFHGYAAADHEYDTIQEEFTRPLDKPEKATPTPTPPPAEEAAPGRLIEDAEPPMAVDWEELKAVNSDIVGWIYVEGQNNISYPICKTINNEYYLHRTFRKDSLFAGAIFEDFCNSPDFSDPNTLVYGHNMKSGSMFGLLKNLKNQDKYDSNPYFWILTPNGNYRYHIYAAFNTPVDSDVYMLFSKQGQEFLEWETKMQSLSEVANSVPLSEDDYTVTLSTCTSDDSVRCVVMGKMVSSQRPES